MNRDLLEWSLVLGALGFALLAALAGMRVRGEHRSDRTLEQRLASRQKMRAAASAHVDADAAGAPAGAAAEADRTDDMPPPQRGLRRWLDGLAQTGVRWLDTSVGRQLVTPEERQLLERCGFIDLRARGLFLVARAAFAVGLPLLVWGALLVAKERLPLWQLAVPVVLGFMLPKWWLVGRAGRRAAALAHELPVFVDLLRLLQGVGLSLDQSLQVMTGEFGRVLPVLASEFAIAQRQFVAGRTREQSLQRLSGSYDNDDLRAVISLLIQLDKHGGAVQEPLRQFGERLREGRRTALRERIGKLGVKMTTVMVLTLLPALIMVTAGPGMLAVLRTLAHMNHS